MMDYLQLNLVPITSIILHVFTTHNNYYVQPWKNSFSGHKHCCQLAILYITGGCNNNYRTVTYQIYYSSQWYSCNILG